jgi:diguanylate cyclase
VTAGAGVARAGGDARSPAASLARRAQFGPFDLLADRAHGAYLAGRLAESRRICGDALAVAEAAGDVVTARYLRHISCLTIEDEARWTLLHTEAERFLAGLGPDAGSDWRAKGLGLLSHSLLQLGRTTEALEPLAEGYDLVVDRPPPAPEDMYNRGAACQAIAFPLFRALLFEPAVRLIEMSVPMSGERPDWEALDGLLLCNVHALWGLFLGLIGNDAEADRHYTVCASRAVWSQGRARAAGDADGMAAAEAYVQFGLQRLGGSRVDDRALRDWALDPLGLRERLPARLALASDAKRQGDLETARELLDAVAADAERWGEPVCAWVAQAWLAQLDEARDGVTAAGRAWRAVAVSRLERLWQDRSTWFEALVTRQRVAELSARVEIDDRRLWEDALTGVANRRLLDATLAEPEWTERACVFVDVDRFKRVNDDHGHEAGDAVLVAIADVLRGLCTSADVVARYGGDEFVVVLADDTDPEVFADRLLAEVAAWPWDVVSPGLAVSVSAGYAGGPDAFARADLALRDTKARRPVCVVAPPGSACVPTGPPLGPAPPRSPLPAPSSGGRPTPVGGVMVVATT